MMRGAGACLGGGGSVRVVVSRSGEHGVVVRVMSGRSKIPTCSPRPRSDLPVVVDSEPGWTITYGGHGDRPQRRDGYGDCGGRVPGRASDAATDRRCTTFNTLCLFFVLDLRGGIPETHVVLKIPHPPPPGWATTVLVGPASVTSLSPYCIISST